MNIVITGATGGIGRACSLLLAGNKDVNLIAISRSNEALESLQEECRLKFDRKIDVFCIDFSQKDFADSISKYLRDRYSSIEGLINNAGILINKEFELINELDLEKQMQINLHAPLKLIQVLIPLLKKAKSQSHVVNMGSMGGFMGSEKFPGLSIYSASKGALAILTECLAQEYSKTNVVFNCLAIGSANTEMLKKAFPNYESPTSPEEIATFIVDFTLNGHRYFNGKVLPVSGISI